MNVSPTSRVARLSGVLLSTLAASALAACGASGNEAPATSPAALSTCQPQRLVLLHTNDIHSHLEGHGPETDYTPSTLHDDATVGGMARIATLVARERERAARARVPLALVDAGDFMMGTLFAWLGTSQAVELSTMQALGYDAVTIGNHELDWTPQGLAGILAAAHAQGVTLPVVASNMVFDKTSTADDGLEQLAAAHVIVPKTIKQMGRLKVGFFGLLGKNAADVTPQAKPLTFEPIADAARRMVAELRDVDKVDVVVALSHSGIYADGTGEDADLAATVPGIDVIVSGHTHDVLTQPKKVNDTWIVTSGAYGEHVGKLTLNVTPGRDRHVELESYRLVDIDDAIRGDDATTARLATAIGTIDSLLAPAGLAYRATLVETAFDLPRARHAEAPLGDFITDAFLATAAAVRPSAPPAVAVEANGSIRAALSKGKTGQVWLSDLYRTESLGIGPDGRPGYPLVTFNITPAELRAGFELDAAGEVVDDDDYLQVSGLKVTYDSSRPLFGRVTGLTLTPPGGTAVSLDPADRTQCVRVVTTLYVAGLLGFVGQVTGGALSVIPKQDDCATPITDLTSTIVDADPTTAGLQELKQWQALVGYAARLPDADGDGRGDIPAFYAAPQGRIVGP